MIGSPPRSPGQFLRKGQGPELCVRTNLAQEPYRFLAIRGSEVLIREAGQGLGQCAADCVPPLHKVAEVWVHHLWQLAPVFNLFVLKGKFQVDLGYNSRDIASIKQLVFDLVLLLEEHGGPHATALIR
ncbi:uncharacterized protein HaLaN_27380, partial [Haematococcus lacustris]